MSHLAIAIPCYGGQITAHCMRSVMQLTHVLRDAGHTWTLDQLLHESLVQRARNTLTMNFMKNADATHLFFIDADILFNPHDVLGMLDADKPIVCGAYPKKAFNRDQLRVAVLRGDADPLASATEFAINPVAPKPPIQSITMEPDKGCIPVRHGATGFMLIQRTALEQMIEAHPEWLYYSDAGNNHGEPMYAVFDCDIVDGTYLSEDWLFCKRWQDLGGEVWLYLAAKLGHYGNHLFQGDLFQTFVPVASEGLPIQSGNLAPPYSVGESSVVPDGGATEWADIPALPDSDPQKKFHVDRYKWAAERIKGKRIANAACGTNYGSLILRAGHPEREVVGFDRSREALAMANKYQGKLVLVSDLQRENFLWPSYDTGSSYGTHFDSVVSLETIEHLERPWDWLKSLHCKELILSVPIIPTKHANRFHLHDFSDDEVIRKLQGLGWKIEEIAYQDEYVKRAVLLVHATRESV